jgi:transcription elongation GreA/GreB family factor
MIKKLIYNHCETFVKSRLLKYNQRSKDLYKSLNSETKSSAGDKHEIGRAMLQIEREKIGNLIKISEKEHQTLSKINNNIVLKSVGLGSIIVTQEYHYYLAISAKKFDFQSKTYYCISKQSPIGSILFGRLKGDVLNFNNKKIKILEIL